MTLAVDAVVIAGGLFLGRLVARVLRQRKQRQSASGANVEASRSDHADASPSDRAGDSAGTRGEASRSPRSQAPRASGAPGGRGSGDTLAGFVCQLGDVVVRRLEGDEAWLAGALVLEESRPVATLFIAPEAGGDRAVLVPGPARTTLTWLAALAPGQVALTGDAPLALEHEGTHFERTRRLPVRVRSLGTGAPHVGASAVLGEYASAGRERLVVVVGSEAAFAWRGVSLAEGEYDVLPGGQSTLDT